jgi:O-antigen/teichoic acid export membrane protein
MKINIFYSLITTLSRLVSGFILLFVLSRYLSLEDFGLFTFSLVVSSLLVLLVEYGYNIKLSKDTAHNSSKISELTTNSLIVKFSLISVVLFILFILYLNEIYNIKEFQIIAIMTVATILNSFANHFLIPYRSIDKFNIEAKYVFFNNIMIFVLVSFVAIKTQDIFLIVLVFLLVKMLYLIFTTRLFQKDFGFTFEKFSLIKEYKKSLPYAVHVAVGAMYLNVDTIILKEYVPLEEIGVYQAGLKALGAATILMGVLNNVLLPKFTQYARTDSVVFAKMVFKFNVISMLTGLVIASIVNVFSESLVLLVYGEKFIELVPYVWLFSIIIFLRYFGLVYGVLLTVSNRQKIRTYTVIFTLFFILISDLFVVPGYKIFGALVVLIIAHIILNMIYMLFTYKEYKTIFLKV